MARVANRWEKTGAAIWLRPDSSPPSPTSGTRPRHFIFETWPGSGRLQIGHVSITSIPYLICAARLQALSIKGGAAPGRLRAGRVRPDATPRVIPKKSPGSLNCRRNIDAFVSGACLAPSGLPGLVPTDPGFRTGSRCDRRCCTLVLCHLTKQRL